MPPSKITLSRPPVSILAEGEFLRLVRTANWEYVERLRSSGVVIVVALTDEKNLLLVEQFRHPLNAISVELPAGLAGDIKGKEKEPLEEAARRELEEETGYRAEGMLFLTSGPASAGMSSESVAYFFASNLQKVGPGGGDESESIEVFSIPMAKVPEWLRERESMGRQVDAKVYAGLYFAANIELDGGVPHRR